MTSLVVSFKPHGVNGWWLRAFTDPYVEVGEVVTQCSWHGITVICTTSGTHRIRTFVRYRRLIRGDGGSGEATVELVTGEDLAITSSNWITNHSSFVPRPTN